MKNTYDVFLFGLYGTLVDIRTDEEDPSFWRACFRQMDKTEEVPDPEALRKQYFSLVSAEKSGCGSCGDPARKSTGPSYSGSFSGMPESRRTSVPCRALPPSSGQPPVPHGRNGIDRVNWNFAA